MICERCGRHYDKESNTTIELTSKSKSRKWNLCIRCKKSLMRYIERKGALYSEDK